MAPANFKAIFTPAKERNGSGDSGYSGLVKDSFSLSTLLVLGGLGQGLLSFILPARYALLPLVFLLLRAVALTVLDLASPTRYPSRLGVIPGRTSAQLPSATYDPLVPPRASPFGSTIAEKGVVVFHLGVRFNHPLGPLSPGGKELAERFEVCHRGLLKRAREYGCLGGTLFRGDEAANNNTTLIIYYFRDLDGLNRFAHADVQHRQAWDWFNKTVLKEWGYSHIGIFHEAFCAPAGAYETIYVNMPPELMGAGHASIKNESTGEDEWVRTVVDASGPVWRSQLSRMGRDGRKADVQESAQRTARKLEPEVDIS